MPISPWLKRFFDCFLKRNKVAERSAARIVLASDGCFCQVSMTVTRRIVALAIEVCVFAFGQRGVMQSMRRVERHLQSPASAVIGGLVVHEHSRGMGIGKRLCLEVEEAETVLKEPGLLEDRAGRAYDELAVEFLPPVEPTKVVAPQSMRKRVAAASTW